MNRYLALFSLIWTSLYSNGMIISFEETPISEQIREIKKGIENTETLSQSPPKLDDLPIYPDNANDDMDPDIPPSNKGPAYFRKKKDKSEIISPEQENHGYTEIEKSHDRERALRGQERIDSTESNESKYSEDYLEDHNSFDKSDSFFHRDSNSSDRFSPLPSSVVNYEKTIMHTALIVFGFILLLLLFVWILRKFSKGKIHSMGKEITILERRQLSHKSVLYLVKVNNKKFLIAESQLEVKAMRPVNIALEED